MRTSNPISKGQLWVIGLLTVLAVWVLWNMDRWLTPAPRIAASPAPPPPVVVDSPPPAPAPLPPTPASIPQTPPILKVVTVPEAPDAFYERSLAALEQDADALEGEFNRFLVKGWLGEVRGSHTRRFQALWEGGMEGHAYPASQSAYDALLQRAEALRKRFQEIEATARKGDVLPGVRREARRKHRFDDPVWER